MSLTAQAPQPKLAWDFNGTTTDYVKGVSGSVGGVINYETGKYGNSLNIKNPSGTTSNSVNFNFSASYAVDLGFSECFWFKCNDLSYLTSIQIVSIAYSGYNNAFRFQINTGGSFQFQFQDSVGNKNINMFGPTVGVWYHLAAVAFNGIVAIYVNGAYYAQTAYVQSGIAFDNMSLGLATNFSGYPLTNGSYDDLRIFDRALTSAQVQSIYQAQGMPSRGVQVKSPIQPGYIYELNNNTINVGTPNVAIINASNPDPRIYLGGDTGRIAQWGGVPNLLTLWDTTPFKYYMIFLVEGYTYPLYISTAGNYSFDFLFIGPGGNTDSFFLSIDSEANAAVGENALTAFTWITPVSKTLTVGYHTIKITAREPSGIAAIRVRPNGGSAPTLQVSRMNMSGTPLFSQLSSAATSSAVGAFSLRAVNGTSAKAVQVRPQGQFPPAVMTSAAVQAGNQFTQTLTGYSFGGAGSYVSNSSSTLSTNYSWKAFDGIDSSGRWVSAATYTVNTPYTGTQKTTVAGVDYPGEWLQLQLPQAIVLSSYSIFPQNTNYPATWNVFASNDGTTWTVIDQRGTVPTLGQYNNYTISGSPAAYSYYRIGCYIIGLNNSFAIGEMRLYGGPLADFYADRLGNLLTAPVVGQSLANWLGGATGYVTTWYDQSGRGNHASQATAANQPVIQRATKGPGYMVNFNGTSQFVTLSASYNFLNGTNITVNAVALRTATISGQNWVFGTNSASVSYQRIAIGFETDTTLDPLGNSTNSPGITIPAYSSGEQVYYMTGVLSPSRVVYSNDVVGGTNADTVLLSVPVGTQFSIGRGGTGGVVYYNGNLFELLIFTSALDQTQVTQVYQNQLGAYGV